MTLFSSSPFVIDFIVYARTLQNAPLAQWTKVVPIYLRSATKWAPHLCHSFRFDRAHTQHTLLIHSFVLLLLLVVVVCAFTTTTTASAAAVVAISVSVFYFCPTHFSKGKCWFLQYFSIGTIRANIHKVKDCWQYIITILLLVVVIFVYRVFSDPSFFCCSSSRCAIFSLNRHAHDRRCPFLACDCDHIAAYWTCLRSFWRHWYHMATDWRQ